MHVTMHSREARLQLSLHRRVTAAATLKASKPLHDYGCWTQPLESRWALWL